MGSMKDFWAREWLLSHIGEQHKTNDLNAALEIAQREGYLSRDGYMTEQGSRFVEQQKEIFVTKEYL